MEEKQDEAMCSRSSAELQHFAIYNVLDTRFASLDDVSTNI